MRACLQYLLDAGGWCKLQALTKQFGSQEPDGFYWDEEPPTSAIGRLRMLGLAFVGRAVIGGRRYKVAVIPEDLRALLAAGVWAKEPPGRTNPCLRTGKGSLHGVKWTS